MFVGILLNVLVSFSIGVIALLIYWSALGVEEGYKEIPLKSFGLFWFCLSVVWMLIATMDFLSYLTGEATFPIEFAFAPIAIAYAFQIFVGLSVVMIAHFIYITTVGGNHLKMFVGAYWVFYGIFLLALFKYGVQPWTRNFFARQITGSTQALTIFIVMFVPLWLLGIKLFFQTMSDRLQTQKSISYFFLLSSLSLLLVGVSGLLDEAGLVSGWAVTATRLGSLVAAILSYVAIFALHNQQELVV